MKKNFALLATALITGLWAAPASVMGAIRQRKCRNVMG